jgi:crossover junction endodeoxyribonuclease RuvC
VLGVDPGLAVTGYAVLVAGVGGRPQVLEAGVVRGGPTHLGIAERLARLHSGVSELLRELEPSVMALEDLYSHVEHPRTAVLMGHARGVICLAASQAGIPVSTYHATSVKQAVCGNGHAAKAQVQRAVQRLLELEDLPAPADVADALALALCHWHRAELVATPA